LLGGVILYRVPPTKVKRNGELGKLQMDQSQVLITGVPSNGDGESSIVRPHRFPEFEEIMLTIAI